MMETTMETTTARRWYCTCGHLRGEHGDDREADGRCNQCDCRQYRPEATPVERLL